MLLDLPRLDESRCTSCGDCVAVCPTLCLAMDGPNPWMPRPGDCVSCGLCVWVCPSDALKLAGLRETKRVAGQKDGDPL